ncbi:transketolase [Candidatus Woesearchaeota archaeon]|nr:transketolase [Candidatus Woesearchaeota archaeon]
MAEIEDLEVKSKSIRLNILKMLNKAGSGHTGGSLGMADVFTALYFGDILKRNNENIQESDRFILSNGHICPVWYSALAEAGYIPKEELLSIRKLGSRLQGHPANHNLPIVEISTGSLGQGVCAAVGLALGYKLDKKDHKVFVCLGDGEMEEGSVWEALMAAAHHKLNNLIAFVDRNMLQQGGKTEEMMSLNSLKEKIKAFNWTAIEADGHNFKEILEAFEKAKNNKERPSFIIFNTHMGQGVSFILDDFKWHGVAPDDEQLEKALKEIQGS